ncbi:MAG: DUF6798 domain-containing protein [Pirellulales bacterium]
MSDNDSDRHHTTPVRPDFFDDEGHAISPPRPRRWLAVGESLLILLVMFLHGASLPPDLNEVHYLGKAKHYWAPTWCPGDFFLDTADAHQVFYWTFGWLTLDRWELSFTQIAWIGRLATWALLAVAWRRLSWALVPRPAMAVASAVVFLALVQRCHMAGEWVVGGVEAKGFAYALVLLGLGSLVQRAWRTAIVLMGAAAAFHVLVGGWSIVALAFAWLLLRNRSAPSLVSLLPAAFVGAALCAPSVVFALRLDWHADAATVAAANAIYVYERLPHHLVLSGMKPEFVIRFAMLIAVGVGLAFAVRRTVAVQNLLAFCAGAVAIAIVGVALSSAAEFAPEAMASVLRYYWFRLADVVVPLGVALLVVLRIGQTLERNAVRGSYLAAALFVLCVVHLGELLYERRPGTEFARHAPADAKSKVVIDGKAVVAADDWQAVCLFFHNHPGILPSAKVLTPRNSHSFKWYAEQPEVGTWKDIPQDAANIVEWMDRMRTIHANRDATKPERQWSRTLADLGKHELIRVARKYGAEYVIAESQPPLALPQMYSNRSYVVYKIPPELPP